MPISSRRSYEKETYLSKVKAVHLSGAGGPGRAYPQALIEATHYGLDFNNIEIINATSVGAIQGLMMALGCSATEAKEVLINMPTETFQDWNYKSIFTFHQRWGLCQGVAMEAYFKRAIEERTGLVDPTFKELFEAGYKKDFRVITTNMTKGKKGIFSYKRTPDCKVAAIVALACSVPFLFPPMKLKNNKGEEHFYTDGWLVQNNPWGVDCDPSMPAEEQLGFMFINAPESIALKDDRGYSILRTVWHYLYNVVWMALFPNPESLPKIQKQRTVIIKVSNHSVLDFEANREAQRYLDGCAKSGMAEFIEKSDNNRSKKHPEKTIEKPPKPEKKLMCLPAFHLARHGLLSLKHRTQFQTEHSAIDSEKYKFSV